jgi:hypothetical protein
MRPKAASAIEGWLPCALFVVAALGAPLPVRGDTLVVTRQPVTQTPDVYEATPTFGYTAGGPLLVYVSQPLSGASLSASDIWGQYLSPDGGLRSVPFRISIDPPERPTNDLLPAASATRVLYVALDEDTPGAGRILLYNAETASTVSLNPLAQVGGVGIHGDVVAWIEGAPSSATVRYLNLSWSVLQPVTISSVPAGARIAVGSHYIAWEQYGSGGLRNVVAYRVSSTDTSMVEPAPSQDQHHPVTSDDWVAYTSDTGSTTAVIHAVNMVTGDRRVIDTGAPDAFPTSIDGDFMAFQAYLNGNSDVFLYRFSDGTTYNLTDSPEDHEFLAALHGDLVAYVKSPAGATTYPEANLDIWVAKFSIGASPPTADAGSNQTVHVGSLATLDGSNSSDSNTPPLTPLTYAWKLDSKPAGSTASLNDAGTVNPTLRPDVMGDYLLSLVVTNNAGVASTPSSVRISTSNSPPIAEAGLDQAIALVGSAVQLNGAGSYDPDDDPITAYQWSFVSIPEGSSAVLAGAETVSPTFQVDVHGDYVIQLVVSDPWVPSPPDAVTVSFSNLKPVAVAGAGGSTTVGNAVNLDGSASFDPNGDLLTFRWSLTSVPIGGHAAVEDPASAATTFVPDLPGTYVAQLIANDGLVDSDPSTVAWLVISAETAAIDSVRAPEDVIGTLAPSSFTNKNHGKTLVNKLNAVIQAIESHNYADALDQLQNDILKKVDGCATNTPPVPDKQDWINNCEDQDRVYPLVIEAIEELKGLI